VVRRGRGRIGRGATRACFQHVCEDDFRASVERITGRKVRAFVSGIDTGTDVSSEVFYLERPAN
jgi:hypothetical protein